MLLPQSVPDRPELFLTGFELASPPTPGNSLYTAPEQWSDQAGPATDQYALAQQIDSINDSSYSSGDVGVTALNLSS